MKCNERKLLGLCVHNYGVTISGQVVKNLEKLRNVICERPLTQAFIDLHKFYKVAQIK